MSAATSAAPHAGAAEPGARVPWADVLMSAVAAVSWALIGMAATAALGLRLLDADAAGSLGPMTAAVVALGAGGSVTPSGDVSAFGLSGVEAATAVEITPLGVSLVGALLLSYFFLRSLRSLRTAGAVVPGAELLARAGAVVALFVATAGGLAWAGHGAVPLDGGPLGLDGLPGGGGIGIPEVGGPGGVEGLLPDRIGDLVGAEAAVGFTVDTVPTLLGGLGWSAGVLLVALLASRRTPLPRGFDIVHRAVRPAVSALVAVLLVAVAAGLTAAVYAAIGDDRPRRIAGAALLGAPNGVWLGLPVGLFVPWDGRASGALVGVLPDPLDDLLGAGTGRLVTLGRLAELDGRMWLLGPAAALALLLAGVLTAVRTPVAGGAARASAAGGPAPAPGADGAARTPGAARFAGRCALRLGAATALTLPLLARLTEVSVNASLSVPGLDAFGAGVELRARPGAALLLGAVWGAGAGGAGALLAWASGAAGRRAAPPARGDRGIGGNGEREEWGAAGGTGGRGTRGAREPGEYGGRPAGAGPGPYAPGDWYRPPNPDTNPYLRAPREARGTREPWGSPQPPPPRGTGERPGSRRPQKPPRAREAWESSGSREPGATGTREPLGHGNAGIAGTREPEDARPPEVPPSPAGRGGPGDRDDHGDLYDAPTVIGPVGPPRGGPRRGAGARGGDGAGRGERSPSWPDGGPPPPPPPPPAPRRPDGGR